MSYRRETMLSQEDIPADVDLHARSVLGDNVNALHDEVNVLLDDVNLVQDNVNVLQDDFNVLRDIDGDGGHSSLDMVDYDTGEIKPFGHGDESCSSSVHLCDVCIYTFCTHSPAYSLCFECEKYLCKVCDNVVCIHPKSSKLISGDDADDTDRVIGGFIDTMLHEQDADVKLDRVTADVVQKIHAYHHLDDNIDCCLSGLCSLEDGRIVATDYENKAIKIFNNGDLQRYIKLSKGPYDVTAIIDETPRDQNRPPDNVDKHDPDAFTLDCKLAVTCPDVKVVLILHLYKECCYEKAGIPFETECLAIYFKNNQIFVLCIDSVCHLTVHAISTEGVKYRSIVTVYLANTLDSRYIGIDGRTGDMNMPTRMKKYIRLMKTNRTQSIPTSLIFREAGELHLCLHSLAYLSLVNLGSEKTRVKQCMLSSTVIGGNDPGTLYTTDNTVLLTHRQDRPHCSFISVLKVV